MISNVIEIYIKIIVILLLASGFVVLISCERELKDFNFLTSEPKLVVNGSFIADSILMVHVSGTVPVMDSEDFNYIDNADLRLYMDDIMVSTATHIDTGFYSFDFIPAVNDQYRLYVSAPGYPDTETGISMPGRPEIISVGFNGQVEEGLKIGIRIKDHPDPGNWYGITIKALSGWFVMNDMGEITDTIVSGYEPCYIFSEDINVTAEITNYHLSTETYWDEYLVGTTLVVEDKLINGSEHNIEVITLDVFFSIYNNKPLYVYLESYDESYMKFLYSMDLYQRSNDNPIAEKVSVYSNVSGGLGVVYGKSVAIDSILISPQMIYWDQD